MCRNEEWTVIRIKDDSLRCLLQVPFVGTSANGRAPTFGVLDISILEIQGLDDLTALIVTGDLQAREVQRKDGTPSRLLGVALAEELLTLAELGELPPTSDTGVILTGDYYCDPDPTRGASGDVRAVWEAFASHYGFVTGVEGNHDTFGDARQRAAFLSGPGHRLLDAKVIDVCGLRIGGVGGVVGNPERPNRRNADHYSLAVRAVTRSRPDVLVVHESPAIPELGLIGNDRLREDLDSAPPMLVCCGHVHWDTALTTLGSISVILNADERCVVLIQK